MARVHRSRRTTLAEILEWYGVETLSQTAARWGMNAGALRIQAARGRLRAVKIGSDWLTDQAERDRYLAEVSDRGARIVESLRADAESQRAMAAEGMASSPPLPD